MNYIFFLIMTTLSIIALITDLKSRIIYDTIPIVGTITIILFIIFDLIHNDIISFDVTQIPLTLFSSFLSGIIIFLIFFIIPIGGGDMKFLSFIACFFGVFETLVIFSISCLIILLFSILTTKKYISKNPALFNDKSFIQKIILLAKREMPMMIGICPTTIFALLYILF